MDNITLLEERLKELETNTAMQTQKYLDLRQNIIDIKAKIGLYKHSIDCLEKGILILTEVATTSRDNARRHFENIVTNALQFVTQNRDYEFVIKELPNRSKTSYEFYIKSKINGVECVQKPEDANGGGFIDIISTALKYAYLEIFADPKIMNSALLYDEPGKMISADMSVKFAQYIKFLGSQYHKQTIMITHNDNLSNVADKTFVVNKDLSGVSHVDILDTEIEDFLNTLCYAV